MGRAPAWSPDGSRIAYTSYDSDEIRVMGADGSGPSVLARAPGRFVVSLDFSPDGRKLLFIEERSATPRRKAEFALRVLDLRSPGISTLPVHGSALAAAWAPSGERIAYLWQPMLRSREGAPPTEIRTMRSDGRRRKRVFTLTHHRWADSISWQPRPESQARAGAPAVAD
jgi:Tol biopolymer transport system component